MPALLKVKRLRPTAIMPSYGSEHASGLDLYADLGGAGNFLLVDQNQITFIPTGIAVQASPGWEIQIRPRSGLASRGLYLNFGTVDNDYRGELQGLMTALPMLKDGYKIRHGDRIAQMIVTKISRTVVKEVNELSQTVRGGGGFGSTGR